MYKIIVTSFLFLLSISVLRSQSGNLQDGILNPYWDFYAKNYLNGNCSGKGNTGIASENGIWGVMLNPGTLQTDTKFQFNIQYSYKTSQPWLRNVGLTNEMNLQQNWPFSGSAGLAYKINKNFQTGFIYSNPTSMNFSLGKIIRTDEFGNEISSYDGLEKYSIHSFIIPFVFNIKNFSAGINLSYSLYRNVTNLEFSVNSDGTTFKFNRFNASLGITLMPYKGLRFGAVFTPGFKTNVDINIANVIPNTSNFPWKAGLGIEYQIAKSNVKLSADYNYANISSVSTSYRDRHNINIGAEYALKNNLTLQAGLFTIFDNRKDVSGIRWIDPVGEYTQYFVTFGASMKVKNFNINASILDSHISPGIIKNTYVNIGLTSNF